MKAGLNMKHIPSKKTRRSRPTQGATEKITGALRNREVDSKNIEGKAEIETKMTGLRVAGITGIRITTTAGLIGAAGRMKWRIERATGAADLTARVASTTWGGSPSVFRCRRN